MSSRSSDAANGAAPARTRVPVHRSPATADAAGRKVYVPAHRNAAAVATPLLPEILRLSAAELFRSVAWAGQAAPISEEPVALLTPVEADLPIRGLFARVAWSGGKAMPPSQAQRARSVLHIFSKFSWE